MKILILFAMIFCHIVDDYYLQGWLASAKQKEWWKANAPDSLYSLDYIWALIMHSFSWAFMITWFFSLVNYVLATCNMHIIKKLKSSRFLYEYYSQR